LVHVDPRLLFSQNPHFVWQPTLTRE